MNLYLQLSNLLFWFALELSRPTIAFSLAERLESSTQLGALLSFQSLLPLLIALPIGLAGDRIGSRKLLPLGSVLLLGSGTAYGISDWLALADVPYLALVLSAQLLNGLAWLLIWISVQSLLAMAGEQGESTNVTSKRVNLLALTSSLGALSGPAVSGLLYPLGGGSLIWGIFLSAAFVLFLLTLRILRMSPGNIPSSPQANGKAPTPEPALSLPAALASSSFQDLSGERLKGSWSLLGGHLYLFVLLGSLVLFVGSEFRSSFMPAYLTQLSIATGQTGLVLTIGAVGVGIVRLLISMNVIRLQAKMAVALSFAMSVAGVCLLPVMQAWGVPALAFISLLLAVAVGIGEPVLITTILQGAHPLKRSLALAGRLTANRAAMLLSPLLAGFAVQLAGPSAGMAAMGGMMAALGLIAVWLFWKHDAHTNPVRREAR